MAKSARFLSVVILLIAANAAVRMIARTPGAPRDIELGAIPSRIGEWQEVQLDPDVYKLSPNLMAQGTLYRIYRRGNDAVELLVVARNVAGKTYHHRPETCFPSSGYAILDRRTQPIPVPKGNLHATSLLLSWRGQQFLCLYWYESERDSTPSYLGSRILMARDRLLQRATTWHFIRVMVPVQSSLEEARRQAEAFVQRIAPQIPRT